MNLPFSLRNPNEIKIINLCSRKPVKQILVVDDNAMNRKTLSLILQSIYPFTIYEARNVRTAQDIILQNNIELIFCDYRMPMTSGLEFAEWLATQQYTGNFVLLTGSIEELETSHVHAILFKPLRKQILEEYLKYENLLE